MRVLWLIAAFMELAAVTLYYTIGLGVGFWLLQLFVLLTFVAAYIQIRERGDRENQQRFW
jgi:UPF0716 family protein affecting phage T7 exclusion